MRLLSRVLLFCLLFSALNSTVLADTNSKNTESFVAFSDVHFDPFHTCKANAPCPLINELDQADAKQWAAIFDKYDKGPVSTYHADTNYPLLKSALAQIQHQTQKHSAKFILITGDFLGHEYKEKYTAYTHDNSQADYQKFVKKTFQFLQQEIQKTLVNIPIYPVVGNNDTYGGDYVTVPNGAFFNDINKIWLPLLGKSSGTFKKTFHLAGYYAVTPPTDARWRVIVLNSVLFMKEAQNKDTQKAAKKQMSWLKAQLHSAEKSHQKVLLAFHVPVGIDTFKTAKATGGNIVAFWMPVYTKEFLSLVDQYHTTISGLISGHTHMDIFQVLNKKSSPVFNTTVPAVSPIFSNNPGFKVYYYNAKTLKLKNYSTYYLDESHHQPEWHLEYTFNDTYKIHCKECDLLVGMMNLQPDTQAAKTYQKYYALNSDQVPFIKEKWVPYAWCGVYNITVDKYQACLMAPNVK